MEDFGWECTLLCQVLDSPWQACQNNRYACPSSCDGTVLTDTKTVSAFLAVIFCPDILTLRIEMPAPVASVAQLVPILLWQLL